MGLISDLYIELAPETGETQGERKFLGQSFVLPPGLPVAAGDGGSRAPYSTKIQRSGDLIGGTYTLTVPGLITATSGPVLREKLDQLWRDLKNTRKLWREDYCWIKVDRGILPPPTMRQGWMSAEVAIIFMVSDMRWLDRDGNEVFG